MSGGKRARTNVFGGRQVAVLEDAPLGPSSRVRFDFRQQKVRTPRWAIPGSCAVPGVKVTDKPHYEQGKVLADPDPLPLPPMLAWQEVPQPDSFRGLDTDHRGYPIPYTLHPGKLPKDRKVDFRVLNIARHRRCAENRLCSICGKPLPSRIYFIGGPMCVQNRVFGDGPGHLECVRYAMRVCPFLSIAPKTYSERPIQARELYERLTNDPNLSTVKPERIVIYVCRQYRMLPSEGQGKDVYVVEPAERVEWYTTDGNYLCTTKPDRYAQ